MFATSLYKMTFFCKILVNIGPVSQWVNGIFVHPFSGWLKERRTFFKIVRNFQIICFFFFFYKSQFSWHVIFGQKCKTFEAILKRRKTLLSFQPPWIYLYYDSESVIIKRNLRSRGIWTRRTNSGHILHD